MSADLGQHVGIRQGHCLDLLRKLPDGCVHMVCTSPPYYGLRDYGLEPTIWDGQDDCDHVWGAKGSRHRGGPNGVSVDRPGRDTSAQDAVCDVRTGQVCQTCGAWRGCLGLEPTDCLYIQHLVQIFSEVRRVLRKDGTLWLNLGDLYTANRSYQARDNKHIEVGNNMLMVVPAGLKPKDLVGMPWRVALALQANGWWLRRDIIWAKDNAMPESVKDRPTSSHEYIFLLAKSEHYFYDHEASKEPCQSGPSDVKKMREQRPRIGGRARQSDDPLYRANRNARSVWRIATVPFTHELCRTCRVVYHARDARRLPLTAETPPRRICRCGAVTWLSHFATFPPRLPERCLLAGTSAHGVCATCETPYRRVLGEQVHVAGRGSGNTERKVATEGERSRLNTHLGSSIPWEPTTQETVRWEPGCRCPQVGVVPALVLDPFAGAGTVGVVAHRLGRRHLGLELNPDYVTLAEGQMREALAAPEISSGGRRRDETRVPHHSAGDPQQSLPLFAGIEGPT